jgi:hypothetical protein
MALAITVFSSGDALAGKGGNGGGGNSLTATISLGSESRVTADASGPMVYGDATFHVTRSFAYDKEVIWVVQQCFDAAGNRISWEGHAALWGEWDSLDGTTVPFPTSGVSCTAFVTLRPWQDRPLGDAIMSFSVGQ